MGVKISAIGCYKPKVYVSNAIWQEKFAPTLEIGGHEFLRNIAEGIEHRYYAAPDETVVSMSTQAISDCLAKSQVRASEVELLIHTASVSDDVAGDCEKIRQAAGVTKAVGYEIADVACAGFMIPLFQAVQFLEAGLYQHAIISCVGNAASRGGNMTDMLACGLGDLATAMLLSRCDGESGLISYVHKTYGNWANVFKFAPIPYGVMAWPRAHHNKYWANLFHNIPPQGLMEMQQITTDYASAVVREALERADLQPSAIQWLITHQAGGLLKTWRELFGFEEKRHLHTFSEVGNCSMSNIPYTLMKAMAARQFLPGDKLLLFAPGTGIHLISGVWQW